eukprot:5574-Heterococcus_DN1.PRE.1
MESADEELIRLRTENTSLQQLLQCKDELLATRYELLATKDKLLASQAADLQHCQELLRHRTLTPESITAAADNSKRQRLPHGTSVSPLDKDEVIDAVFGFVGGGEHLYVSGVSKRWRDRYLEHCVKNSTSGLRVSDYTLESQSNLQLICCESLEPEKVITLLRLHGAPWSTTLCNKAALYGNLALLQWLHSHACPWAECGLTYNASAGGSVAVLEWLLAVLPPFIWSSCEKMYSLSLAGCHGQLPAMQWFIDHSATWPDSFVYDDGDVKQCWSVPEVQWALAHGSGWRQWKCEDYADDGYYYDDKLQQRATELLDWAHANGCPCTCGQVQQQQQQQ